MHAIRGLLGFRPLPMPPHVFTVEPGRLSYGRFERAADGFELASFREQELPEKLFQSGLLGGPIRDPADFDAALGSLLERLEVPVQEASLVIPDTWLRVAFSGVGNLPSDPKARTEVLRWKLKRLVPFRVEELRIGAIEVRPLPGADQEEPRRVVLAFALEALLDQLEKGFAGRGVRIGQITSSSLAVLGLMADVEQAEGGEADLVALALVEGDAYTLAFARQGEPVLQRFKATAIGLSEQARGEMLERDLKLTRRFLEEQLPSESLGRVFLVSPPEREPEWIEWLEAGLGQPVEPLGRRHLMLTESGMLGLPGSAPPWRRLAPMLGAASREVA